MGVGEVDWDGWEGALVSAVEKKGGVERVMKWNEWKEMVIKYHERIFGRFHLDAIRWSYEVVLNITCKMLTFDVDVKYIIDIR